MAVIRLIDIQKIGLDVADPTDDDHLCVGEDIVDSFSKSGFAYLKNHGISKELQEATFSVSKEFFSLDDDKKLTYERFSKTGYNGFTPLGGENTAYNQPGAARLVDYKECYDLQFIGEGYPDAVLPAFGRQLERLADACCRLSSRLLRALDAALSTDGRLVSSHQRMLCEDSTASLRVLHYPPVPDGLEPDTVRCASHTDYGTITLLFQDDVGGLELETSEGVWMQADPIPDTILVNIGDMMELWTAGRLRATSHRVLVPESELVRRVSRYSMVFFVHPDDGVMVAPLSGDGSVKAVDSGEFVRKQFAMTYSTFENMSRK